MRLSFIIPLYNCEKYIEDCLDSIYSANVDLQSFEVIVINDGSKDDGLKKVEQYSKGKSNLILISQENHGVSSARNRGLDVAKGDYIWFVDADDKILFEGNNSKLGIHELVDALREKKYELICFNYKKEFEDHIEECVDFNNCQELSGTDYLKLHKPLYLWNKIFKKAAIDNIRFVEGTKNIEDMYFDMKSIINMNSILCLPFFGYNYNQTNLTSTSRNRSPENLRKLSDDTQTIHRLIKTDIEVLSGEKKLRYQQLLNMSGAGYLFSLVNFYPYGEILRNIERYRVLGLYPVQKTGLRKYDLFLIFANHKLGLKLLYLVFNKLKS